MSNIYIELAVSEFDKTGQDKTTVEYKGYTVTIEKKGSGRKVSQESIVEGKSIYNNISADGSGRACDSCGGTGRA